MTIAARIAVIPARGGSKRLPRKNILPVEGHPMISYPIRAAKLSGLFDEVIVSTEDGEIAEVSREYGALVVSRPEELARDTSKVVDVCEHVLNLPEFSAVETFCCIYATAILLETNDLTNSLDLLESEPVADYVMGVSHYNYHPVQALREQDGFLSLMWKDYLSSQSQQYPELVVSNGTLYWARRDAFLRDRSFYGERLKGYTLDTIDIDTELDYQKLLEIANWRNLGATLE